MVDAMRRAAFDIKDPMAVFAMCWQTARPRHGLSDRELLLLQVRPRGSAIAGNLRLDPRDRDKGKIYFGYYEERRMGRGRV